MKTTNRYSPEVRERAVRLVREQRDGYPSQWAAICSIAGKIGCTPETLRTWYKRTQASQNHPDGSVSDGNRVKQLEREVRELKRANEILRKAAAFFATMTTPERTKLIKLITTVAPNTRHTRSDPQLDNIRQHELKGEHCSSIE